MTQSILLTGGNGFIAVHILALLLQRGYNVTTTVRSESKTTHLRKKFEKAVSSGQLKFSIVEDIAVAGAFDSVIKNNNFDAVLHTSSPVAFQVTSITEDLLNPAIKGTTELLKSVKSYGSSVKRVVITSSFVSIMDFSQGDRPGYVYSEKDWNPISHEQAKLNGFFGYFGSKTFSEKAAWDFVENEKPSFDLTTICPPFVYGPVIQEVTDLNKLNSSSSSLYSIFSGQEKELKSASGWLWADVRNVADAHVAAIEKPEAGGQRFVICEGTFSNNQVADFIWEHYPERAQAKRIPKSSPSVGLPPDGYYTCDNSKSKAVLGIKYIPFESMLKDQMAQFVALEKELGIE